MSHLLCNDSLKNLNKFNLDEILSDAILYDKPYQQILVFPTGKFVRYFKQYFIREYYLVNKKPLSELKIFTLQGFIQIIFDSLGLSSRYKLLSDGYRLALFEEAVNNSNLKFYSSNSRKIPNSVLMKLFSLIYGLREDGITVDKLKNDFDTIEKKIPNELNYFTDSHRLSDIIKIFESYEKMLENQYIDFPKLLNLTIIKLREIIEEPNRANIDNNIVIMSQDKNSVFQNIISKILGNDSIIYINGFTDFKKPEIEFLSLFVNISNPVGINIDYALNPSNHNGNGPLFGNLEQIIIDFHNVGFHLISLSNYPNENIETVDEIIETDEITKKVIFGDISGFLRRWLFNSEKDLKNPFFSKFLKILIAENRKEEVKLISKLIRYLINFKDYAPGEICVCSRQPELYSGLFREIFSRYRIPANITDRFNLSQSPVVNAILSILNIINGGYKIDDVAKALSSQYLDFEKDQSSSTFDKKNLIDIAKQLRIRGGFLFGGLNEWTKKFDKTIQNLKSSLQSSSNKSYDDLEIKRMAKKLELIQKASDDFNCFLNQINFKTKDLSSTDFEKIVIEIIKQFKIIEIIEKNYKAILEEKNEDEFARNELIEQCENDSRAIHQLKLILEEMILVINEITPNLKSPIEFYIERLKTIIINTKYQVNEKQGNGVTVTSIEQTRGLPFKIMILCGAIDGEFLLKYTPNQFLGIELADSEKKHIHSERMLFYQFLTNSTEYIENGDKQIFITYFKSDDSGEKVRSPFIDALLKITKLQEDNCILDLSKENYFENKIEAEQSSKNSDSYEWINSISNFEELYYHFSRYNQLSKDSFLSHHQINNFDFISNYLNQKDNSAIKNHSSKSNKLQDESINKNDNERVFSITELETYSSCPFKYFVKYSLNIEEPVKVDYTISPIELGSLLHIVLYRFYSELQTIENFSTEQENTNKDIINLLNSIGYNKSPVYLDPAKQNYYLALLIQLTNEELQKIKFEHPFFDLEIESIIGYQNNPGHLKLWLDAEIGKTSSNWGFVPALFEVSFGLPTKSDFSFSSVEIDNTFKLKGKIDRIEFYESDNKIYFIIADYKSNLTYTATQKAIKDGISFQMPLYLTAAKLLLDKNNQKVNPLGAVYYNLKPKYNKGKVELLKAVLIPPSNPIKGLLGKSYSQYLNSDDELEEILQNSANFANVIINNISSLIFPVNPLGSDVCKRCKYSSICRIKEKKMVFDNAEAFEE